MTNFELIDDYLSNRLSESDKTAFEQAVAADPSLKSEIELQKNILEGIKKARVAELKAMLNNVPIGAPASVGFTPLKMAASIIGVGILVSSLYYYFQSENINEVPNLSTSIQDSVQEEDSSENVDKIIPAEKLPVVDSGTVTAKPAEAKTSTPRKQEAKPSALVQPKIDVVDPTEEMTSESSQAEIKISDKSNVSSSPIQVETNSSHKKYNFHYQFKEGKLLIYGPFDKNLYEILEINGEGHSVFLYYQEKFYLLDEKKTEITKLSLIEDNDLLKKLKEYRARN